MASGSGGGAVLRGHGVVGWVVGEGDGDAGHGGCPVILNRLFFYSNDRMTSISWPFQFRLSNSIFHF